MKLKQENKVYCKNCKWFETYTEDMGLWKCSREKRIEYVDGPLEKSINYHYREPFSVNRSNDCKDYERKWWKIWK